MHVVFVFDDEDRVRRVMWDDDGVVKARTLYGDGSVSDDSLGHAGLHSAMHKTGGYSSAYATEVDDLRSAFQYLGKAADLVETLPEVNVVDAQPSNSEAK